MKTVVSLVLALFVGQTPVLVLEPERLNVRDMKDWSIVVSRDALESERYAAEASARTPPPERADAV